MPNIISKDKRQWMLGKQGTLNSQAGDEAFLDAFSTAVTGLDATWSTPIDLSTQVPTGIVTATINNEERVTEVDLNYHSHGMGQLSGSIDVPEWGNLKECTIINLAHNSFDTQYPSAIHKIGSSLEYLYLNYSDHSILWDTSFHPHEKIDSINPPVFDPGKDSGTGNNIIRGSVPNTIDNLTNLKWFVLAFSDDFGSNGRAPNTINGISDISQNLWNISTLELIQIYDNWNIGNSGNTFEFPSTIGHITNLRQIYLGGGTGSDWRYNHQEATMMQGTYPTDLNTLTTVEVFWVHNLGNLSGLPDLSQSSGLLKFFISTNDLSTSDPFPDWLVDGSIPNIDGITMSHQSIDPKGGMSGSIPDTWNIPHLDNFGASYHGFDGSIPLGLWDTDPAKMGVAVNNFTSVGRIDLTGLSSMINIRWHRNEVEGEQIPYLDWGRSKGWNRIRFERNRYVFQDMLYVPLNAPNSETALELYFQLEQDGATLNYSPQNPAGTANTYTSTDGNGDIVIDDFDATYGHTDNSYQWQKSTDNGSTWSDITGATSKTYTITGATSSDNGLYRVQVTNSTDATLATNYGKTAQTLTSKEITVSL